jgi:hypothetical protein
MIIFCATVFFTVATIVTVIFILAFAKRTCPVTVVPKLKHKHLSSSFLNRWPLLKDLVPIRKKKTLC